jgi:hypothetical protein
MNGVDAFVRAEYQYLAAAAPGLTTLIVGALLRWLFVCVRGRAIRADVARLVRWAAQTIPATSQRYGEVAALLSKRWPGLSGEQIEVLIQSEVHALKQALAMAPLMQPPADSGQPAVPVEATSVPLAAGVVAPAQLGTVEAALAG